MEGTGRLVFEHRPSDSPVIERVWRSRSLGATSMMSVARAHWDFVWWEGPEGRHAGIQGPESKASPAPVPAGAEFVGVRMALGVHLPGLPLRGLVDRFVGLAVDDHGFALGAERIPVPRYEDAEAFVALLVRKSLLLVADAPAASLTDRTRQRRHLVEVGLPRRTVLQIERAHAAVARLRADEPFADVAQSAGYFDQAHLSRSLRRFIGVTATELATGDGGARPLSLLYKTGV